MSVATLRFEPGFDPGRTRTGRFMTASFGLHALFVAWLLLQPRLAHQAPLTEITWLEGEEAGQPAAAQAAPAPAATGAETHFRRLRREGDERPAQQSDLALGDRMSARLTAMQQSASGNSPLAVSGTGTAAALATPAVPAGLGSGGASPLSLHRGGGAASAPPLEMTRGGGPAPAPVLAQAAEPARASASAPAAGGDVNARRTLAGASIIGPVADRAILRHETPAYPEWAKRDAVEGVVTLSFVVRADGTVKENVLVQKTAGFQDFDENARAALLAWRFEPLHGGRTGEQWGTITFRYRLQGAN